MSITEVSFSPELIVTLFVLASLTIPAAIGGVIVYRGTYYKSLPAKVLALEEDAERKDAALKRQAAELELWKGIATQTPEIQELVKLFKVHHEGADERFNKVIGQHEAILTSLVQIREYMERNS
jgi:hypothetical protein